MSAKNPDQEIRPLKTFLARALYDNEAEVPSELTFSRGDLLTILDRNPKGCEGWCICNIRGKIGIAPGNRLEILGLVNQTKGSVDTDIYDDPAEFYVPETRNPSNQQVASPVVYSAESLHPSYENIDDFARQLRLSGLTDSGHYSNRSSDQSLSVPCGTNPSLDLQMTSNPMTDCTRQTYEDTNRKLSHTFPKQYKHQLDSQTIMSSSTQQSHSNPLKSTANKSQLNSFKCSSQTSFDDQKHKPKSMGPHLSSDTDDLSIHSESISHSSCSFLSGDLPTHFQTKFDFIRFWNPILERLKNESQVLMEILYPDSKPTSSPSPTSPVITHSEFDQDLLIINQLCTFMIAISKRNLDTGLTRKFVLHRQTLENLGETFEKYWKLYHHQQQQTNRSTVDEPKFTIDEMERLFKTLQSELDILGTTILANFSLLFPNSSDRNPCSQQGSSVKSSSSSTVEQIPKPIKSEKEGKKQDPKSSPQRANVTKDNGTNQSDSSTDQPNNLRYQIYRILSLCDLASDDVQSYMLILLNSSHTNDHSSKLLSLIAAIPTKFSPSSSSPPSSSSYTTTTTTATTTTTTPSVTNTDAQNQNSTSSSFVLNSQFMICQTKHILCNCSRLVQLITELCSLIISHEKHEANSSHEDYVKPLPDLRFQLESCGDKICESLKGLITQTKESTRHMNATQLAKPGTASTMPIPGPLLQRLIGAVRSVGFSLDKIRLTLSQFLENYKSVN